MVLKSRLSFFPPPGAVFTISSGRVSAKTRVESYDCQCQGPEEPHEHYFFRWKNLAPHANITVTSAPGAKYRITVAKK